MVADGVDGLLHPRLLYAVTLNAYRVCGLSPVSSCLVLGELKTRDLAVCPLTYGVTRYAFTNAPLPFGVFHATVARALPATAVGLPGFAGTPICTGSERCDA